MNRKDALQYIFVFAIGFFAGLVTEVDVASPATAHAAVPPTTPSITICGRIDSTSAARLGVKLTSLDMGLRVKFMDMRPPIYIRGTLTEPLWRGNVVNFTLRPTSGHETKEIYDLVEAKTLLGKCGFDGEPDSVTNAKYNKK